MNCLQSVSLYIVQTVCKEEFIMTKFIK